MVEGARFRNAAGLAADHHAQLTFEIDPAGAGRQADDPSVRQQR